MFEIQLLRMVVTTCLLMGQGQLIGSAGTVMVKIRNQAANLACPAPPVVRPANLVWIGMQLESGDSLLVRNVAVGSIAARYSLRVGDRIAKVEGKAVDSLATLTAALSDPQRPAILVEVIRDGREFEMLIARPQRKAAATTTASHSQTSQAPSRPAQSVVTRPVSASRSLNITTGTGTLVLSSRQRTVTAKQQLSFRGIADYYDRNGQLVSVTYEGELPAVRSRLGQLPHELRRPAVRWLNSAGNE